MSLRQKLAARIAPSRADEAEQLEDEFERLYAQAAPYTMTSRERMYALWQATRHTVKLDGDIVECGVWRGGSSMLAALTLLEAGDDRRGLWLFDTYEGMPEPGPDDVDITGAAMTENWEEIRSEDGAILARASLDDVQANLGRTGIDPQRLHYVVGKVEDTIPAEAPERISLLRLDTDWYESTRHELEHLWQRLEPGGVLIIDDYGHWQGARKAVDEFFAGREDAPLLNRIDYTGRIGVKA